MGYMKTCLKCGISKERDGFYAHPMAMDRLLGKCRECVKSAVRDNYMKKKAQYQKYEKARAQDPKRRQKALEYQRKRRRLYPEKEAARRKLGYAVRTGKIKRMPCAVCGDAEVQAHHTDYSRPLDVQWLCWAHHMEAHNKEAI